MMLPEGMHLVNFTVNLISEKKDERIPIAVAGQIMVDIQDLFMHIGEYLVSRELRIQSVLDKKFDEKFRIYMDENGGISFNASTDVPETSGRGNIVDDAINYMDKTLDSMGSENGGFWMEDNYIDAIYRNMVIYDLVALHQDLAENDGYALMYGTTSELKRFGKIDVDKMSSFISSKGLTCKSATVGVIRSSNSKSGRYSRFVLANGSKTSKISFENEDEEKIAEKYLDCTPIIIAGIFSYSEEGELLSVNRAGGVIPAPAIKFSRMVSSTGDVRLKEPLTVCISYSDNKWELKNENLGMCEKGDTWDSAVQSFHDYFVFLWTQYADSGDAGLSEEELEVKRYLLDLIA